MNKCCLVLLAALLAFGADPLGAAPAPSRGLDKISAYAGTWKSETRNFKTPYSKAGKETAEINNDCWRSGDFYACHQVVNGKTGALVVYTYDAKHDLYHNYAIPPDGGKGGSGELIIKGNVWTFPWKYEHAGSTTYFRVVNVFTTPGSIEYRQEYSTDQRHWTVMSKGSEARVRS